MLNNIYVVPVMGKDFILFVDDFSPTRVPPSSGKRYYMFGAAASGKS
jgi:hypothetical protein